MKLLKDNNQLDEVAYKMTQQVLNSVITKIKEAKGSSFELSNNELSKIEETIYYEILKKINTNEKDLKIPTNRKRKVLNYQEGTPIEKNKGVITSRTYDSFVTSGGEFIPASKTYLNENGALVTEFFETIGILDKRLTEIVKKYPDLNLPDLNNASLFQINEVLDNLVYTSDFNQNAKKASDEILDIVSDAYINTTEKEMIEKFESVLKNTKKEFQSMSVYEALDKETIEEFSKQGTLFDSLRNLLNIKESQKNTFPDNFTDEFEYSESKRDNASTTEIEKEDLVKKLKGLALTNKQLNTIIEYVQSNEQFKEQLTKALIISRENAEELIRLIIEQNIDDIANTTREEVDYSPNSVKSSISFESLGTNKDGEEVSYDDIVYSKKRGGNFASTPVPYIDESNISTETDRSLISEIRNSFYKKGEELDSTTTKLFQEFIIKLQGFINNLPLEGDLQGLKQFVDNLSNIFSVNDDVVTLMYSISKLLEEADAIETSVAKRVDMLNLTYSGDSSTGPFDYNEELQKLLDSNPEIKERYLRSKLAKSAFDSAGGVSNPESIKAIFNINDDYLQFLGEKFEKATGEIVRTFTKKITEAGKTVEVPVKEISELQDLIIKTIINRMTIGEQEKTSLEFRAGEFYQKNGIKGEEIPPDMIEKLTPQQKTTLFYKAGLTGYAYGGKDIDENLANAQKLLIKKKEQLANASEEEAMLLEAEIEVTQKDIAILKEAKKPRERTTPKADSDRKDKNSDDDNGHKRDLEYQLKKQKEKATKELTKALSKSGAVGEYLGEFTSEKIGTGSLFRGENDQVVYGKIGNELKRYLIGKDSPFSKGLKDFTGDIGGQTGLTAKQIEDVTNAYKEHIAKVEGKTESLDKEKKKTAELNQELKQHAEDTKEAINAEKGKTVISKELAEQLLKEKKAYDEVSESAKKEADIQENSNTQAKEGITIRGIKPTYVDTPENPHSYFNPETGDRILSITQLRDLVMRGSNPSFKADIENIKEQAKKKYYSTGQAITAKDLGISEKDYKFMVHDVIAQGIIGDTFHDLIDKLVKTRSTTLKGLKLNTDNPSLYGEYIDNFKKAQEELAYYGIKLTQENIDNMLESYMDSIKKQGLDPTKFSEQMLGFEISGPQGKFSVGVKPDQLYSSSEIVDGKVVTKGAVVDNKLGKVKGYESFQLTGQILGILSNLDTEIPYTYVDHLGNLVTESKKLKDLVGNVDFSEGIDAYIADVEEGTTKLKKYVTLSLEEMYQIIQDGYKVFSGEGIPYSKEEIRERMERQMKTGGSIGHSSSYQEQVANQAEIDRASNEKMRSPDLTNFFNRDVDKIIEDIKNNTVQLVNQEDNLVTRKNAYVKALGEEKKAIIEIAKRSTLIQTYNDKIAEIKEETGDEEDSQILALKEKVNIEEKYLEVAKKNYELAKNARQETKIDEEVTSGNSDVDLAIWRQTALRKEEQATNLGVQTASNKTTAKAEVNNITQVDKVLKQYLNTLKERYKIEEQLQRLQMNMEDQSGVALKNSQLYETSLKSRLADVEAESEKYKTTLNSIGTTQEQNNYLSQQATELAKQHNLQINKINASQKTQRNILKEIASGFKQAFANLTDASIAYTIIGQIRSSIQEVLQLTKNLDSAMVDLQIASGESYESIHDTMLEYVELGNKLGRTVQDIASASNDWLRAGYTGQEAAELIEASTKLSTLGMIETSEATSYLISVLKGWKLEASEISGVVDKLTVVKCGVCLVISIGHKFNCR